MWEYNAEVIRVVDGDTLALRVDLGFCVSLDVKVRLYGVDCPEMHTVKKGSPEYVRGVAAKQFVEDWVAAYGRKVKIVSVDGKKFGKKSFDRWLAEICPPEISEGESLSASLVRYGHANYSTG